MPALRLFVTGRVQGVSFRASAEKKAAELGVRGWVRNTPDGAVEAHAEGSRKAVDDFAAWCKKGPEGARVDMVDVEEVAEEGYAEFAVR